MKPYFKRTKLYSYVIQLYLIFLVAAAFGPMYSNGYPERSLTSYVFILFTTLVFKYINMRLSWWMLKIRQESIRRIDTFIRFCLSSGIFVSLITQLFVILVIFIFFFSLIDLYDYYDFYILSDHSVILLVWTYLI